jgi:hypothetical protein
MPVTAPQQTDLAPGPDDQPVDEQAASKPSKPKTGAVVPIKAPPADIPFPGGCVSPVRDGQVAVILDPGTGARTLGGTTSQAFTETLLEAVLATLRTTNPADAAKRVAAAAAAVAAFKPTDEIEAMLAGQAVAMHHMAMECFRRAILPDQHPDTASKLRRDGANLCRGVVDMVDALDRKRGKVSQTVRVERVVIHEGAQALIGNVAASPGPPGGRGRGGGDDDARITEQPRTRPRLASGPVLGQCLSPVRGPDPERGTLPRCGSAEPPPLPAAWGPQHGAADGRRP